MELLLNNALQLTMPEGFHVMDEAERAGVNSMGDGPFECVTDPGRHMTITVGWKQVGGFPALFLQSRDLAKNMEAQIRRPMQPFGYSLVSFTERQIGGEKTHGFRYTYTAQETKMTGESYALKKGKVFYYLHLYTRELLQEENLPVWEEILDSIVFQK